MNQRGFTLVEIIIALTILSILFIVISYIQARGAASYAATSQSVEVQESLRIALNKMSRELKGAQAGSIEIEDDGQKILFSSAEGNGGFRYDAAGQELETDVSENIRESWQPFASNICEVSFQYDPNLYFVDIVIKGDGGSGVVQEAATGVSLVVGR
ncbi:MAG: prepilin-type N-terminal cleavage/methylation domain-containing protein [Syntrophaceticus sp.]|jgi:prepilin-type N-terminal cleavage/methylation domain-containing protein|nr:prepilin-type N-terminal cleavage/methylation domain-containing protein [Syntrophaceticus sp.]MDD4783915.1 prepilin-type N-terminal cleavage/methylation domain-containing protein [Syntrophaceticus sp.]